MVTITQTAVFVHIPKNAGTSISKCIGGIDQYWPMHVPWRCLKVEGKPCFGFLRNPWERMVSQYNYLLLPSSRHAPRYDPTHMKQIGFKKWLMDEGTWMNHEPIDGNIWIRQNQRYMPVGPDNTYSGIEELNHPTLGLPPLQQRPSMWWLDGLPPENIKRVETIEQDFAELVERFKIGHQPLIRTNHNPRRPRDWRAEYDNEMIDFVEFYHHMDIEYAGYTFEGETK